MKTLPNWITFDKEIQSVCAYKEIELGAFDSASIDICGLGYYELYVNGKKVSADLLTPAWTDYFERDFSSLLYPSNDRTGHRILFNRYDLKEYFREGKNLVCVAVGNGFLRQQVRYAEGDNCYSEKLLLSFDITVSVGDKTEHVYSDSSCVYSDSFIKFNNVYFGERHDYEEYDECIFANIPEKTYPCIETERPVSPIMLQECPSDKVIRRIPAELIAEIGNKKIYKLAENITGHAVLRAKGGNVKLTYSEEIKEDSSLDYRSTGGDGQIAFDEYLNTKEGQILHPHFTWHGFRYFDVEGECEVIGVDVVHTDMKQNVTFNSSNENLNWLFNTYIRTQLDNCHGGVPSDCPHRERLGYTGDGQLTAEICMLTLDSKKFYEKWIRDILDCQDLESGHVQHTAPFYGGGGGPGGWGGAMVIVPYLYYKRFGNTELIKEAYPHMVKWIGSMESFSENNIVVREYEGGWCLGDWCTLDKVIIPEPFVNTYYLIKALGYLVELGKVIGEDTERFEKLKSDCEKAFVREFYNAENGTFVDSIQGADAFGYDLGLGDERTLKAIVDKYDALGHFDTGIFGTDILCKVLSETKNYDLLFKLLSGDEYGTFGYMKKNGATTLWEEWNGHGSHNHPMFGSAAKYLVFDMAGLNHDGERFVLAPNPVEGLDFASAEECSDRGNASVSWKRDGGKITVEASCDKEAVLRFNGEEFVFTGKTVKEFNA